MRIRIRIFFLSVIGAFFICGCNDPFSWLNTMARQEEDKSEKPTIVSSIEEKGTEPVKPPSNPVIKETAEPAQTVGFVPSDCSTAGILFQNITSAINNYDPFNGPYLICNSTSTAANGLNEIHHVDVHAVKPEFLASSFEDQKGVWKPKIDDAIAWKEKNPTASTEIIMIRDDETGYIYIVLTNANVQGCLLGEGYGTEIAGSYLVNLQFSSCAGNSAEYLRMIESLRDTARKVIERVEKK